MHGIICDAIRARRLLRFVYDGYERIVEPHMHGINGANHEVLSGWLVGGWSESRPEPGWRNYLVHDMHYVEALAERFDGPRPRYNPFDPQVRQVFCRLEPASATASARAIPLADMPPAPEALEAVDRPAVEERREPPSSPDSA